jgi:hypothetical protein
VRRSLPDLKKSARITGAAQVKLASDVKKQYERGRNIRELAARHARPYGFIHRMLVDNEVAVRRRGGDTRTKKK